MSAAAPDACPLTDLLSGLWTACGPAPSGVWGVVYRMPRGDLRHQGSSGASRRSALSPEGGARAQSRGKHRPRGPGSFPVSRDPLPHCQDVEQVCVRHLGVAKQSHSRVRVLLHRRVFGAITGSLCPLRLKSEKRKYSVGESVNLARAVRIPGDGGQEGRHLAKKKTHPCPAHWTERPESEKTCRGLAT